MSGIQRIVDVGRFRLRDALGFSRVIQDNQQCCVSRGLVDNRDNTEEYRATSSEGRRRVGGGGWKEQRGSGVLTLRPEGKNPFLIPQGPESWGRWQGPVNCSLVTPVPKGQSEEATTRVVKELSDGKCTTSTYSVHAMQSNACVTSATPTYPTLYRLPVESVGWVGQDRGR